MKRWTLVDQALTPDGKQVVSSGPEARIRWWNPDNGETARISYGSGEVNDLLFSKDGKTLVSASADSLIRLWDSGNTGQKRALTGAKDWLFAAAITADGKLTAGGGADGIVRLWETDSGRLRLAYHDDGAASVALAGDFNGWNPEPLEHTGDGTWRTR